MAINANLRRMTTGDQVVGGALALMLIASFCPWISVSLGNPAGLDLGSISVNGYHSWGFLYWLVVYLGVAFWVIRVLIPEVVPIPALPLTDAVIYMASGVVALVGAVLYQSSNSFNNIAWGWFLAIIGAAGLVAGGFLKQKDPAAGDYAPHPSSLGGGTYQAPPPYTPGPAPQPPRQLPQGPAQPTPPAYPQAAPPQPAPPQPAPPHPAPPQPAPQPAPPQPAPPQAAPPTYPQAAPPHPAPPQPAPPQPAPPQAAPPPAPEPSPPPQPPQGGQPPPPQ